MSAGATVAVVGGLHDGAEVATWRVPLWGFVGPYGDGYRIYRRPGRGRELYRLGAAAQGSPQRREGRTVYVTQHHVAAICSGCGVYTAASSGACRLCGEKLPTLVR